MKRHRSRWTLSGLFSEYVLVDTLGAAPRKDRQPVPISFVSSLLDAWLASPLEASVLHDIYESLGGSRPHGLTALERQRHDARLKRSLIDALQRGRLVALEIARAQPVLPVDQPEAPPQARPPEDGSPELTFIALQMVDEEGAPVPGVKYRLTLPDGSTREGALNANGYARLEGIPPGPCRASFPELDRRGWERS